MAYEAFYVDAAIVSKKLRFTRMDGSFVWHDVFFDADLASTDTSSLSFTTNKPTTSGPSSVAMSLQDNPPALHVGLGWIYPAGSGALLDAASWSAGTYANNEVVSHNNIVYVNDSGGDTTQEPGAGADWTVRTFEDLFPIDGGA